MQAGDYNHINRAPTPVYSLYSISILLSVIHTYTLLPDALYRRG